MKTSDTWINICRDAWLQAALLPLLTTDITLRDDSRADVLYLQILQTYIVDIRAEPSALAACRV